MKKTKKIPLLSYNNKEIEKWLFLSKKPSSLKNMRDIVGKKTIKATIDVINKIKKISSKAFYIRLYNASFLLAVPEKRRGHSPQQECEKEFIFCVQRLVKNDALWRLGNDDPATWFL
jgi:hypothetical protein